MSAVVTGLGLVCALGTDAAAVFQALQGGASGLSAAPDLARMPGSALAGRVVHLDLGRWLQRRKDRKLMARPSELALPAFGQALGGWPGDRLELGLFCGVGREPPTTGTARPRWWLQPTAGALATPCYGRPRATAPLLPLQTLPNMALAHVSINLGICGENGAWAGGPRRCLAGCHRRGAGGGGGPGAGA